jgi:hypothetical protein
MIGWLQAQATFGHQEKIITFGCCILLRVYPTMIPLFNGEFADFTIFIFKFN